MQFSSPLFLFLFLPLVLTGYWLLGRRLRSLFLFGMSIFLYAWNDGRYVLLLAVSIVLNYGFGILAARYRESQKGSLVIWFALVANLGVLLWYKYAAFIAANISILLAPLGLPAIGVQNQHLPLGLSFFTFQAIAYVLDVYREESEPQKGFIRFGLFMALFPKLAAGPIIRYEEVAEDLQGRKPDAELLASGIRRFVIGLGKKVLIADTIARTSEQIFALPPHDLTSGVAWLGLICYTLQIYFDFSGYSDMAIGLGRMLGFRLRENFDYPYIARSLTEFWRRWHISLSTWFRDYLFIPLSYALMTDRIRQKIAAGRYRTNYRSVFSIFVVFTLCGLWHGAGYNFIAWGMLHGAVLGVESLWLGKVMKKWRPLFQHAYLLSVIMLAWVLFRTPGLGAALSFCKTLAGFSGSSSLQYHLSLYLNSELLLALLAGVLGAMPLAGAIADRADLPQFRAFAPVAEVMFLFLVLLLSCASLANSTFSPFIYQQF